MKLHEAPLGSRVLVYLNSSGGIVHSGSEATRERILESILVARKDGFSGGCLLGWEDGKTGQLDKAKLRPQGGIRNGFIYALVKYDYLYDIVVREDLNIHGIVESKVVQVTTPDVSDWRAWVHNVPGECVCGIPRERCDYHRR